MIYSRFGSPVEITAYCGKHKPKWASVELALVRVKYLERDGGEGYQHPTFLRADGGLPEIDAAVDAAPEVELTAVELKKAIKDAE